MFGCWRTKHCTAVKVPGWAVTLLQSVRSVCNLIHAVFVFSSLSWCLHDSAVLPCSPRLLPAAPAPPRPAVCCHHPGHVLLLLLTMMQIIRVPNCWRPLTGYTEYRTYGLQETACSKVTILTYVGGEQSPSSRWGHQHQHSHQHSSGDCTGVSLISAASDAYRGTLFCCGHWNTSACDSMWGLTSFLLVTRLWWPRTKPSHQWQCRGRGTGNSVGGGGGATCAV